MSRTISRCMKLLLSCIFSLMLAMPSYAQKITIKGSVVDFETGETLIGVGVSVKGTKTGTITDLDGLFSVDCPSPQL